MANITPARPAPAPEQPPEQGAGDDQDHRAELDHLAYVIRDLGDLERSGQLRSLAGVDLLERYLSRRVRLLAPAAMPVVASPAIAASPPPAATTATPALSAASPPRAVAPPSPMIQHGGAALPPMPRPLAPPATPRVPVEPAVILLWLGAFLVTIASLIFVAYNWAVMSGPVKTALMAGLAVGFLAAGLVTGRRASLKPASLTFYAIGATLTPLTFVAAYNFWLRAGNMDWRALGTVAALVSAALYARMALARLGGFYAWAAVAAGGAAIVYVLWFGDRWVGYWPVPLVGLAYAGLTWAPRLRQEPWDVFRRPLLTLATVAGVVATLIIGLLALLAMSLWESDRELRQYLAVDLIVMALVLGIAATQRRWAWLAGSALVAATLAVPPALTGFPAGAALATALGGPSAGVRFVLTAGAALALLVSFTPTATWRSVLRWYALPVALVAPWIGLATDTRAPALNQQLWSIVPTATTAGLAIVWLTALAWRATRPGWLWGTAAAAVAGFWLLAWMIVPRTIDPVGWASLSWLGLAFTGLAAVALALAADDEPWLDVPAVGLVAAGTLVTPWPWNATVLAVAAVLLWLIGEGWLPLGARAHRQQATWLSALAVLPTVALGFIHTTFARTSADWYLVMLPLVGLTVLGLLVAHRHREPVVPAAPLVTGTLAIVTVIAAQPYDAHWIVALGSFYSVAGIIVTALGALALLVIGRAPRHWHSPLRVYAALVGAFAPWWTVTTLLPVVATAGLAVAWAAVATWRGQRPRWLWLVTGVALVAFAALATALSPLGLLAGIVAAGGVSWTLLAFWWLLAGGVATLAALDRRPAALYPALGLLLIGLVFGVGTAGITALATVLWLSGSGTALALASRLASRRWSGATRPLAEGGAALALAGTVVALGSGSWLATTSPVGPALFLLMISLALSAAALRLIWLGEVASAAGLAWLLHLFLTQQRTDPQWYALATGLWLVALAIERGRRGDLTIANTLTALSGIAILGPTLVQSLTGTDTGWRYFLLGLTEAVVFLAVGLRWRLRVSMLVGVLGLGLIAGYQVFDGLRSLPNWAILGILGSAMLVVAVALLLLRDAIARTGAEVRHQWETWR
ncbi:MAG: hypothetical protein IT340_14325 [Chloroflexi bacterium]|nr:hypothetical protein [Chloroflexota bacterium]